MSTNRVAVQISFAIAFGVLAVPANATKWFEKGYTCPICSTENTFRVVGSYGSYIYRWPSKFYFVFWPYIDSNVLYSCKSCHLTVFMEDFSDIPGNKIVDIRDALKTVSLKSPSDDYADIPMLQRLDVAQLVYQTLGRDKEFWCHFWRVKGYHLTEAGNEDKSKDAWERALEQCQQMLEDSERESQKKSCS